MNPDLIALDELYKLIRETNLTEDQLFVLRDVKPDAEIDGIQYWDKNAVVAALNAAKGN